MINKLIDLYKHELECYSFQMTTDNVYILPAYYNFADIEFCGILS